MKDVYDLEMIGDYQLKFESRFANVHNIKYISNDLRQIDIGYTNFNFDGLIILPDELEILNCYCTNLIDKLERLPKNLKKLKCYHCNIVVLPKLPNKLRYLDCSSNYLTSLPELPDTLTEFYCSGGSNYFPFRLSYHNDLREVRLIQKFAKYLTQLRLKKILIKYLLRKIYRRRLILISPLWLEVGARNSIPYNDILVKYF